MKTGMKILIGIGVLVLLGIFWFVGTYNTIVTKSATVDNSWADVETQYQRRVDLIPNLVSTVKGYAAHEEKLFTEITELRSQWQSAAARRDTAASAQAASGIDNAISRLLVVVESYPNLKANENFLSLQDELAGTENRVGLARTRYNAAVQDYNVAIQRFPTNILAGRFGFSARTYFQADAGSDKAPTVKF